MTDNLVKVDLSKIFDKLDFRTYKLRTEISTWLTISRIKHKFMWDDTGKYLPSAIYMEPEAAVAFMLKYDL